MKDAKVLVAEDREPSESVIDGVVRESRTLVAVDHMLVAGADKVVLRNGKLSASAVAV